MLKNQRISLNWADPERDDNVEGRMMSMLMMLLLLVISMLSSMLFV